MLKIENVNVSYGQLQVLWDINLNISEGEFVAIVGSNGAGKSTLLKTISGLLKPMSGNITLNKTKIDDKTPEYILKNGIGLVPEHRLLFPNMSVLENLEMGAYLPDSWSKKEETLEQVYETFPRLKERQQQKAGTLSGGEQQMLAIGRTLMTKPELIMLDEPSLGLAPKLVSKVLEVVTNLNASGMTVLLVEQNVRTTLQHSSRAYVLESGKIALEGNQEDLLDNDYVKKAYLGM